MAMVCIKCPNCGGALELDNSKEFGFCMFCDTQVYVQDEITKVEVSGSVTFDESEKYNNLLNLANQAYAAGNLEEAYTYYTKALKIKQNNYFPVFRKGLCAGYLSGETGFRIEEVVWGIARAYDLAPDPAIRKALSEEIVTFAITYKPHINTEFYSSDDCARYVITIHNKVSLLNRLYPFVDKENAQRTISCIEIVLEYCSWLNAASMQFKAGATVTNGKSQTVFGTYPVPQNIIYDAVDIRKRFVEEFNKYIVTRIELVKSNIAKTKH
jgi:tetratricopeptide (TPR) repeat protein